MYAVIETGGKQLRVREGDLVRVERLDAEAGQDVTFDRVLCLAGDGRFIPGNPTVPGAVVLGRVEAQARGRKVVVFKYKAKVNYRRKSGHRQAITAVRITAIRGPLRPGEAAGAAEGADAVQAAAAEPEAASGRGAEAAAGGSAGSAAGPAPASGPAAAAAAPAAAAAEEGTAVGQP